MKEAAGKQGKGGEAVRICLRYGSAWELGNVRMIQEGTDFVRRFGQHEFDLRDICEE